MKKKICGVILAAIVAVLCLFVAFPNTQPQNEEYLRIHIRANSNEEIDQSVKLQVKNAVVEALIPLLSQADSKQDALNIVQQNITLVSKTAENALKSAGFLYGARAAVKNEEFPVRNYGELTLPQGNYDAIIIELGAGDGDNWWCVAFPPLCFIPNGGKNIVYKSKIMEMIQSWKIKTSD